MEKTTGTPKARKKKRRMRLPNGLGSVHKINDGKNRRKPWRARVPSHVVVDPENGRATQKYITLGYFESEADAIQALMEYRKEPYTVEAATATFTEVYEAWKAKKFPDMSVSTRKAYNTAYNHNIALHKMKMRDIRTTDLERIMAEIKGGYGVQMGLKNLWSQMFKFAMERDLVTKNYAEFVSTRDKMPETKRSAIPPEDLAKIWEAIDQGDQTAEITMIYIYTGMRPAELLEVKKENVDLESRIMIGGLKTDAGKDRHIPLHRCIMPYIERLMQTEGEYLIMRQGSKTPKKMGYEYFRINYWHPFMERLGMNYTGHYTRHTTATMLREANVAEDIRKLILGHKSTDITDRYTHIKDDMLVAAMDTVPGR